MAKDGIEQEQQTLKSDEAAASSATEDDIEAISALYPLPANRWRSLGQHLDYTDWPDRDRFMALDRELKATRNQHI